MNRFVDPTPPGAGLSRIPIDLGLPKSHAFLTLESGCASATGPKPAPPPPPIPPPPPNTPPRPPVVLCANKVPDGNPRLPWFDGPSSFAFAQSSCAPLGGRTICWRGVTPARRISTESPSRFFPSVEGIDLVATPF